MFGGYDYILHMRLENLSVSTSDPTTSPISSIGRFSRIPAHTLLSKSREKAILKGQSKCAAFPVLDLVMANLPPVVNVRGKHLITV